MACHDQRGRLIYPAARRPSPLTRAGRHLTTCSAGPLAGSCACRPWPGLAWPAARCPAPQDRSDLLVGPARSADLLITTPSLFITLRVVFIAILIIIIAHLAWRRIRVPGRCTLVRTCPDRVGSLFSKEKRDGSRRNYTYCITLALPGHFPGLQIFCLGTTNSVGSLRPVWMRVS